MSKINYEVLLGVIITTLPILIINIYQIFKVRSESAKLKSEAVKIDTEASGEITDTALSLMQPLKDENARLAKRVKFLERGIRVLRKQLVEHKLEPVFNPYVNGDTDAEVDQNYPSTGEGV